MLFIPVMQSWIFSIIIPYLVSHDPSEIILICTPNISHNQYWKQSCCLIYLWKPVFPGFFIIIIIIIIIIIYK